MWCPRHGSGQAVNQQVEMKQKALGSGTLRPQRASVELGLEPSGAQPVSKKRHFTGRQELCLIPEISSGMLRM